MPQPVQPAINAATRLCAVFGLPVVHSASPAMHNAAFTTLGLNWRYLAFEVDPKNLQAAIDGAKAMQFAGLNLTVPHKLLALEMVDALDDSARMFGAVNTIRLEGRNAKGVWLPLTKFEPASANGPFKIRAHGFNTDAVAIARTLREELKLELRGAKVVLLGAGGTGRTAALKFAAEKVAELSIVNRTRNKAEKLAGEIKKRFPSLNIRVGYPQGRIDLLVNATSLGLKANDPSPLDEKQFSLKQTCAVYDVIYRPAETALLKTAKAAGCKTANGLGMLLHQGAAALEIWTGKPAPLDVMRKALEAEVYKSTVRSPQS
ncbi:MAG TPA: shikimate dehydrogenase [Candidatus Baltobacteraceae bacterium]|nr:shikimate dehydrogenase [Candidatus Baltobacteraceae bacterium]